MKCYVPAVTVILLSGSLGILKIRPRSQVPQLFPGESKRLPDRCLNRLRLLALLPNGSDDR